MEEDGRIGPLLELVDDRLREVSVHRDVSVEPRVPEPVVDVRLVGETPEVVLGEPEDRVRNDVVVASRRPGDRAQRSAAGTGSRPAPPPRRPCRPPPRRRARSSSDIALAIQVTSCWRGERCASAVTSPPPPRRATRCPPSASRGTTTGPRFETTISSRRAPRRATVPAGASVATARRRRRASSRPCVGLPADEQVEEREPVAQEPRREEVDADVLLASPAPSASRPQGRRARRRRASAHSSTVSTRYPVSRSWIWSTIPPTRPATTGRRLPERLGHRQAEPLADRLLQHRGRVNLEGVHLDRADVVQVREDEDVWVAGGRLDGLRL